MRPTPSLRVVSAPPTPSNAPTLTPVDPAPGWPRLLSRQDAARYLSVSTREIDRLIEIGKLAVVRLPAGRHRNGASVERPNRRVLIDRLELDALCTAHRERVGR